MIRDKLTRVKDFGRRFDCLGAYTEKLPSPHVRDRSHWGSPIKDYNVALLLSCVKRLRTNFAPIVSSPSLACCALLDFPKHMGEHSLLREKMVARSLMSESEKKHHDLLARIEFDKNPIKIYDESGKPLYGIRDTEKLKKNEELR